MAFHINRRDTWAQFISADRHAHAAGRPQPSTHGDGWFPVAGVFIHHRGDGPLIPRDFATETECMRDIADVYLDHVSDDKFNGDIAYNFFVCPHGEIYEGRGYQRGEANHQGYIDDFGRNAGFYSICGLLNLQQLPTDSMLRSFRDLIRHLREAPTDREAETGPLFNIGPRIVRHSYQYATECPGNLSVYAQPGSTIDPSVPWSGTADGHLYDAQAWVNKTYTGVAAGYERCSELGHPGWPTVLSLTQGLQHELGISPTVRNFGPTTFNAVKARNLMPEHETNPNLVRIYNGAMWAKGYWASTDQGVWNVDAQRSLARLYADAGFDYLDPAVRQKMWPHIVKALMRMDQFQLVPGGDAEIQQIQRRLNSRYVGTVGIPAMGLVPCDGYYSRDVQQGLMMGLQYEIGIDPAAINGNFGPGTQAGLRSRATGRLTGNLRQLFRSACYFNSPTYTREGNLQIPLSYTSSDIGTDTDTGTHLAWLRAFQAFSQIPVTATNDYTTWAQLLVSTGDSTRPAAGCDCVTEITSARGRQLYAAGYRIVGRYLDEHLAPGDDGYLGKALKPGEPQAILDAGLRLLPLFQWNNTELVNFDHGRGLNQALRAHEVATRLRIPAGTCIYFAVDYDATDEQIESNILPYFNGIIQGLEAHGNRYTFGVYGSRNVCSRVSAVAGARWSLVSGMSWGFSGNLGFPLPANWSFNQIREYFFEPGWGLDHDVWRLGADPGVSALDPE